VYQEIPQRSTSALTPPCERRDGHPKSSHTNSPVDDALDLEEMRHVLELLWHKWKAFSKRQTSRLAAYTKHNHAINIKEGKKVPNLPIYNLLRRELDIL
jgi:hypothetical protein